MLQTGRKGKGGNNFNIFVFRKTDHVTIITTAEIFQIICIIQTRIGWSKAVSYSPMAFPRPASLVLQGLVGPVRRDEGHAMRAEVRVKV